MERLLEELSFEAPDMHSGRVVDQRERTSKTRLKKLAEDEDLSKFIL